MGKSTESKIVNGVKPSEFEAVLDMMYGLAGTPDRKAVLVSGEAGAGKSQIAKAWGLKKGFTHIFDFRGATQLPEDMTGMPHTDVKDLKTIWLSPEWIPEDKPGTKMLLLLEELNRAPKAIEQAMFQAITENRIHTHVFPKFTMLICLINPENSIYHVNNLDPAMHNRFFRVDLMPDVDEWLTYMHQEEADDRVIQFISVQRDLLSQISTDGPYPTPRSWKNLSDVLKATGNLGEAMLGKLANGWVGTEASVAFIRFCDRSNKKPVGGKEILADYKKVENKLKEQRNDEMNVTVQDLCNLLASGKPKLNKVQFGNLKEFLLTIKAEWKVNIIQKLPPNMLTELSTVPELIDAVADILHQTNKTTSK